MHAFTHTHTQHFFDTFYSKKDFLNAVIHAFCPYLILYLVYPLKISFIGGMSVFHIIKIGWSKVFIEYHVITECQLK